MFRYNFIVFVAMTLGFPNFKMEALELNVLEENYIASLSISKSNLTFRDSSEALVFKLNPCQFDLFETIGTDFMRVADRSIKLNSGFSSPSVVT